MYANSKDFPEIICIGQVLMDCIIQGDLNPSPSLPTQTTDSITLSPGGDAFNEAVIFSRLGHRVQILCGLGRDMAGNALSASLRDNGVDTSAIVYGETHKTPVSALFVNAAGNRRSVTTPAHRIAFFTPSPDSLPGASLVSLASLFRAPLDKPSVIHRVCRAAKAAGALVAADVKLSNTPRLTLEDVRESLPYIDYLFPNETEAEFYTGERDPHRMADVFLDYGVKNVILKLGADGCLAKNEKGSISLSAYPVDAVDTTGAGDNFAAGFLSSLLRGAQLKEALEFGTACAAICIQSVGAVTGVTDREQINAFLSHPPGR